MHMHSWTEIRLQISLMSDGSPTRVGEYFLLNWHLSLTRSCISLPGHMLLLECSCCHAVVMQQWIISSKI